MAETLKGEDWQSVSFDEIVVEFLRAEDFKLGELPQGRRDLIHSPDLSKREENIARRQMLASIRGAIFQRMPPDTKWYLVRSIGNRHLNELLAIGGNCGWDAEDRSDKNELIPVAARWRSLPFVPLEKWHRPILWGHSMKGPFSIFDGMNRFVGHVQQIAKEGHTPETDLNVAAYFGLSPQPCHLHFPDSPAGIYSPNPLNICT